MPLSLRVEKADPQGVDALALLREAAIEARALYPELTDPAAPWPTNAPTPAGGVYLVAYTERDAVACGAMAPLESFPRTAEVRRMFVTRAARRQGVASAVLRALESHALQFGYRRLLLETGFKQQPAIALYESHGYVRIEPFGKYVGDPTSVCFEKRLSARAGS